MKYKTHSLHYVPHVYSKKTTPSQEKDPYDFDSSGFHY